MIARFDGEVLERDDYWVVCTTENPSYWWGNFILFREPPAPGDGPRWVDVFQRELGVRPRVRHMCLAWDSIDGRSGDTAWFLEQDFEQSSSVFMTAQSMRRPERFNEELLVRPLQSDSDWEAALAAQLSSRDDAIPASSFDPFMILQYGRYRSLVEQGRGQWFGAFLGGELMGAMGVLVEDGLARCQTVATAPEFRNRGVCSTLVHEACSHALKDLGADTIVMLADPEGQAARVYVANGFVPREFVVNLSRSGSAPPLRRPGR